MISKIYSAALYGISPLLIEVEISVTKGLRIFNIVGLPDKAIAESKERVQLAIRSIGLRPPCFEPERVLINLAPASLKKEGSLYDLPIALGYLLSSSQTKFDSSKRIFLGELSLDGKLKPIKGALSFAILAQKLGFSEIILPKENSLEACLLNLEKEKIKVIGASTLKEVLFHLEGKRKIEPFKINPKILTENSFNFEIELSLIKGQDLAKRALEISAAGGHNLLFEGPPGTGKTILAKSIVSILPPLKIKEILELTQIYSLAGLLTKDKPIVSQRPFRAPHHSASEVALIGGGNPPLPGEISLAHRGILFLDEFPEFHRDVLESLRQPLEEGEIRIQRAKYSLSFPAKFTLISAANPCPCGNYRNPEKICTCLTSQILSYRRKLRGPLIDRIDLFVYVPQLKFIEIEKKPVNSQTELVRERVLKARKIQQERFKKEGILTNSEMKISQIENYCQIDENSKNVLGKWVDKGELSVRGYHKVLKVARTIADLDQREKISLADINEALAFRKRDLEH